MFVAGSDLLDLPQPRDCFDSHHGGGGIGVRLAMLVIAPAIHVACAAERTGEGRARCYFGRIDGGAHRQVEQVKKWL